MTSIKDFTLDPASLTQVGHDLARPECVLALPDGTLFISDNRGLITRRSPSGEQTLFGNHVGEPNGLAMDNKGRILVASMEGGKLLRIGSNGEDEEVLLSSFEGEPLGAVNFVFCAGNGRRYVAVSTRQNSEEYRWWPAVMHPLHDGYVLLIDENDNVRRVADGINFTNEVRLDADGKYLYAVETMGKHMLRFPVHPDGSVGEKEIYGPEDLGVGAYVDGFAFDIEGNLWLTTVTRNGVMIITPDGEAHTVFEDVREDVIGGMQDKVNNNTVMPDDLVACAGPHVQLPTSICFAGPDRRTVYIGSLAMPHLLSFQSPIAGLPMSHWKED